MRERFTPYQRGLFVFLSVATFFEGYDFIALTQILPNLRADLKLGPEWAGYLVTFINLGTVIAYLIVRRVDRWGRRRVLTVTIAGYTVFTFLSGLSPNVYVFGLFQMCARIFLIAEWATSTVVAAEEFPASRRGMVIGVISAFGSFGSITCAGLVPTFLKTAYGWRSVYFVGIIPLLVLAYARRNLRETRRFAELTAREQPSRPSGSPPEGRRPQMGRSSSPQMRPMSYIWRTPHRKRVLQMGAIWMATYVCTQNAVTFWKEFAVAERQFSDAEVGQAIALAAVVSLPLVFLTGKLIDTAGRRPGAAVVFVAGAIGTFGCYTLEGKLPLTLALILGIFSSSAVLPVLNAFTTELFPTELRGDAFAWSNNLIGRITYVLSPVVVALIAKDVGWGPAVRVTAVFPLIALGLIFLLLPETRLRELEETSSL